MATESDVAYVEEIFQRRGSVSTEVVRRAEDWTVEEAAQRLKTEPREEVIDLLHIVHDVFKRSIYNPEVFVPTPKVREVQLDRLEAVHLFERALMALDYFAPVFTVGEAAIIVLLERRTWWQKLLRVDGGYNREINRWRRQFKNNRACFIEVLDQIRDSNAVTVAMGPKLYAAAADWMSCYEHDLRCEEGGNPYRQFVSRRQ